MTEVTAGHAAPRRAPTRLCRRRSPSRALSLPRRLLVARRDAKEADLAGLALRRQRLPQFVVLEDHVAAGVELVDVDVVGAQRPKRPLELGHHLGFDHGHQITELLRSVSWRGAPDPVAEVECADQHAGRQGGAYAFTGSQPQVEQWFEAEVVQH